MLDVSQIEVLEEMLKISISALKLVFGISTLVMLNKKKKDCGV